MARFRHHLPPPDAPSTSTNVAVIFSGWLGVTIPHRGRVIKEALITPLEADVIVAGTFLPSDCLMMNATTCAAALWNRLAFLAPLAASSLDPMPTHEWLVQQVEAAPHWPRIKRQFNPSVLYQNLSLWAPVIGTRKANVLRELVSYEKAYSLLCDLEERRGRKYRALVFSRLEYEWLGPHPPLRQFEANVVWAPPADTNGFNDRHGLMPRAAGEAYFRRWTALLSPRAVVRFSVDELVTLNPETFLKESLLRPADYVWNAIIQFRPQFKLGEFPMTAWLACCEDPDDRYGKLWRQAQKATTKAEHQSLMKVAKAEMTRAPRCWAHVCIPVKLLPPSAFAARMHSKVRKFNGNGKGGGVAPVETLSREDKELAHYEKINGRGLFGRLPTSPTVRSIIEMPLPRLQAVRYGKYVKEQYEALHAWRWHQCVAAQGNGGSGSDGGKPAFSYRIKADEMSGQYRTMQLVVPAGDYGLHMENRMSLAFVLLNRSADTPSQQSMRAACPLAYVARMKDGEKRRAAVGYCPQASPPPPPVFDGTLDVKERRRRRREAFALAEASKFCGGSDEQSTLLDCVHACIACSDCNGLSFSLDVKKCTLHKNACKADDESIATNGNKPGFEAMQLLQKPDAESGWDVISMRREQLKGFVGTHASKSLQTLPVPKLGHCGGTDQGEEGHCLKGDKGSLPFGPKAVNAFVEGMTMKAFQIRDELACVTFCAACPRCRYVSVSTKGGDCSWYRECPYETGLQREPRWLQHKTYDVAAWVRSQNRSRREA